MTAFSVNVYRYPNKVNSMCFTRVKYSEYVYSSMLCHSFTEIFDLDVLISAVDEKKCHFMTLNDHFQNRVGKIQIW